jgi:CTP synthase (UTP-ammonia lyase)
MLFFLKDIISFFRLKCCGIEVTSIKIDPFINIDAGKFSLYEHGNVGNSIW